MLDKHELSPETLKQIPAAISDPIMVFDSATQPDSMVVVTELKHEGKTVVATLHLDVENGRARVNAIGSIHPRASNNHFVNWINSGLMRYANTKKSREWFRKARLQLPGMLNQRDSGRNYKTEADIVKYSVSGDIKGAYLNGKAKDETGNIRRGKRAMQRVIDKKVDVLNAMHREGLGSVSFYYGEEGV